MLSRKGEAPFIGVLCDAGGRDGGKYVEAAEEVGHMLGSCGYGVAYNAGLGSMGNALATSAMRTGSPVIGVISRRTMNNLLEDRGGELPIGTLHVVDAPAEKARVLQSLAALYIALPGGFEVLGSVLDVARSAVDVARPVVLVNVDRFFDGLTSQLERCISAGFSDRASVNRIVVAHSVDEIPNMMRRLLRVTGSAP
ncbi:LOG family protein [Streptomyces sp. NPDC059011]|uniref:LOG family protein n=1 Tax=unclassified Streptomyces TaxID=2593676 RepID=UPI00369AE449